MATLLQVLVRQMRALLLTTVAMGFVLGLGIGAYQIRHADPPPSTSLAGSWRLSLQGPQGALTVSVKLTQQGGGIVGTMTDSLAGEIPITGQIADGRLDFSVEVGGEAGEAPVVFSGRLMEDGTLVGTASAPGGEIVWSARRASGQNADRPVQRGTPASRSA